jgi:prophage regulatory protein
MADLPEIGFVRLPQIIGDRKKGIAGVIPVSRATWWRGVASGKYPAGMLHGRGIRMWSVESIRALIEKMDASR